MLRWIHENGLKKVTLPDMYQYSPVCSAGTARIDDNWARKVARLNHVRITGS